MSEWRFTDGSIRAEILDEGGKTVCDWDYRGRSEPPSDEHGRLMAAAPELLATVHAMVAAFSLSHMESPFGDQIRAIKRAEAAIAKATKGERDDAG